MNVPRATRPSRSAAAVANARLNCASYVVRGRSLVVRGSQMMSHYGAAKAAVINFTTTLAMEWAPYNIRVNCIAPGPIETEGYLEVLHRTNPNADEVYRNVASRVALGRWGRVEEIAYPTIFLASEASSFMTGTTINIDGGPARRELD